MPRKRHAKVVVLKPEQERVPEFHRYAARLRARGQVVNSGDSLMVYRIDSTVPEGPVLVTSLTEFIFTR